MYPFSVEDAVIRFQICLWLLAFSIPLTVVVAPCSRAWAQEEELGLIDKIETLQQQLASDDVAERDKAEAELISMGPSVLDYLEASGEDAPTDLRERVTRVRTTLEKSAADQFTEPSEVTIKGSMTVGDALEKIMAQTRNEVEVSDASQLDIAIKMDLEKASFWKAIEQVTTQAGLQVDRYGNRKPGQLMLAPSQPVAPDSVSATPRIPSDSAKIFLAQVLRVDSSANLLSPRQDFTTISLLVRWEPRLRPISLQIPMGKVSITDEFGDSIMLANPREVVYGMVQPEIPEVEFSLRLPRVDRQIEEIKSLKATVDAVLPGRAELFRFKKVSRLKSGHKISKAGAHVSYGGTRKNEDVYSVKVSLSFDEENNALESHQGWVFQNEVYLLDDEGKREDALSLETLQQDNERVTVNYYFLEEPGDRTLVYRTPSTIVKLPVELELTKIPMP